MKKLLLLGMVFLFSVFTASASFYVDDPNNCPQTNSQFPGQHCAPNVICGVENGFVQCIDPSSISAPTSSATSTTLFDASFSGGYLIDCLATADSSAPFCDNGGTAFCNRDSSCYSRNRFTECTASSFGAFSCGSCMNGFTFCDGSQDDTDGCEVEIDVTSFPGESNAVFNVACAATCEGEHLDCDGDLGTTGTGCEVEINVTSFPNGSNNHYGGTCNAVDVQCNEGFQDCDASGEGFGNGCEVETNVTACTTSGGAPGVYVGGCTCIPSGQDQVFTNILAEGSGDNLIWAKQNNSEGNLLNLSNNESVEFVVNASGCIIYPDGSSQCSASNVSVSNITSGQIQDNTITDADISDTTNLTLGEKITFALGEAIDNIVDGWITVTGNLNVTGNLTVNGETIENLWTQNSTEVFLKPTAERDVSIDGNLTAGGIEIVKKGSNTFIRY